MRAYQEKNGTFSTSDMDIAAWLKLNGFRVTEATRSQRDSRKFQFSFADPDHRVEEMIIKYADSQAHDFANALRTMKMLVHK